MRVEERAKRGSQTFAVALEREHGIYSPALGKVAEALGSCHVCFFNKRAEREGGRDRDSWRQQPSSCLLSTSSSTLRPLARGTHCGIGNMPCGTDTFTRHCAEATEKSNLGKLVATNLCFFLTTEPCDTLTSTDLVTRVFDRCIFCHLVQRKRSMWEGSLMCSVPLIRPSLKKTLGRLTAVDLWPSGGL